MDDQSAYTSVCVNMIVLQDIHMWLMILVNESVPIVGVNRYLGSHWEDLVAARYRPLAITICVRCFGIEPIEFHELWKHQRTTLGGVVRLKPHHVIMDPTIAHHFYAMHATTNGMAKLGYVHSCQLAKRIRLSKQGVNRSIIREEDGQERAERFVMTMIEKGCVCVMYFDDFECYFLVPTTWTSCFATLSACLVLWCPLDASRGQAVEEEGLVRAKE